MHRTTDVDTTYGKRFTLPQTHFVQRYGQRSHNSFHFIDQLPQFAKHTGHVRPCYLSKTRCTKTGITTSFTERIHTGDHWLLHHPRHFHYFFDCVGHPRRMLLLTPGIGHHREQEAVYEMKGCKSDRHYHAPQRQHCKRRHPSDA